MTWEEICADPALADVPFLIESDRWGNIIMRPLGSAAHSDCQSEILRLLHELLPDGYAQARYPVQTTQGVKGIDAVWVSRERHGQRPENLDVHLLAPEICVEVVSPADRPAESTWRFALYFEKGAQECWACDEAGNLSFFDPTGQMASSRLCPDFPAKLPRGGGMTSLSEKLGSRTQHT